MTKVIGYQAWVRFYKGGKKLYWSPKEKLFTKAKAKLEASKVAKSKGVLKLGGAYGYREVYQSPKQKVRKKIMIKKAKTEAGGDWISKETNLSGGW